MSNVLFGFDIGGTRIKAVAVQSDGTLIEETECPTIDGLDRPWADAVAETHNTFRRKVGEPCAIGICGPGIASASGKSIWWMQGRMQGLEGFDWQKQLNAPRSVQVINDAQAGIMGEHWIGSGKSKQNVVMLTLGTGVGGAVIVDGNLLRGAVGRAGHMGHTTVNPDGSPDITQMPGSLEDAIGECTLAKRSNGQYETTAQLLQAARNGDQFAMEVWDRSVYLLTVSIAGFINLFDPEIVILGGGISAAGDDLFVPVRAHLDRFEWRPHGHAVPIVQAALGGRSGALGAAYNAKLRTRI